MKKVLSAFLMLALIVGMLTTMAITASAAESASQNGIELSISTNKDNYNADEEVDVTIKVKNTNTYDVNDLTLTVELPEGLSLKSGDLSIADLDLVAGAEYSKQVVAVKTPGDQTGSNTETGNSGEQGNNTGNQGSNSGTQVANNANSPQTGDDTNLLLWVLLLVASAAGIVLSIKHRKNATKALSLFLCVFMVAAMVPFGAFAIENNTINISVDKTITVNGKNCVIKASVSNSANQYAPEPDDSTFTRGEWITILAEKIGLESVELNDNYDCFYGDSIGSEYGPIAETFHAYGLLPEADSSGYDDPNQDIPLFEAHLLTTREYAAYTVAKAMGYQGDYEINCSDIEAIKYQNEVAVIVQQQFLVLSEQNTFNPEKPLVGTDKNRIFDKIDELNHSLELNPSEVHDNTQLVSGVYKDELSEIVDYSLTPINEETYSISFENKSAISFAENDIIILPQNSEFATGVVGKIKSISFNGKETVLICSCPEIEEVFSKIDFADSGTALVSDFIPAEGIQCEYDSNGSVDENTDNNDLYPLNINVGGTTKVPGTLKFTIAEKKISEYLKASGSVEIEVPAVTCKLDANFGLFNTRINEFTLSIQEKIKLKGELKYTLAESGYELTNSLGNTRFEKGRIELGRLPIAIGTTGLSFDIVFFYNIEAKATASITYTIVSTQGYQYKNGAGRAIFDYDDSLDFLELKGSAKAGLGIAGDICAFKLMDIIGYSVEAGIALNASFTPHVLATDTLYCGDLTLYAYCTSGLDKETAIGKFLEKVCHYTLEFEHLKNDANNPFKLKLHLENGHRVNECTFGMGGISGYVASLNTNAPINNARISIYNDAGELIRTLFTNSQGKYSVDNLTDGTYKIVVAATGYLKYEVSLSVRKYETTYIENLLMVDRNNSGASNMVTGNITDAVTGQGIADTSFAIRTGWNNVNGTPISSGVFSNSVYELTLGDGNYTLEVSKTGYVTNHINLAIGNGSASGTNIVLSPESTSVSGDSIRIVLTWGEYPLDLDSHLFGSEQGYHTYYSSKNYYENSVLIADLDLDDTTSYGPETTTIHSLDENGLYRFYVHDYSNRSSDSSQELSKSSAKVQVYVDNQLLYTFNVPTNNEGTVWHVFDYDASTDSLTPVNQFSYSGNPETLN